MMQPTPEPKREDERMEPGKEALRAAFEARGRTDSLSESIKAAYAIDFAANQQAMQALEAEIEKWKLIDVANRTLAGERRTAMDGLVKALEILVGVNGVAPLDGVSAREKARAALAAAEKVRL